MEAVHQDTLYCCLQVNYSALVTKCSLYTALQVNSPLFLPRTVRFRRGPPASWRTGAGTDGPVDLLLPGVEQLLDSRVGEVVEKTPDHLLGLFLPLHESLLNNKSFNSLL